MVSRGLRWSIVIEHWDSVTASPFIPPLLFPSMLLQPPPLPFALTSFLHPPVSFVHKYPSPFPFFPVCLLPSSSPDPTFPPPLHIHLVCPLRSPPPLPAPFTPSLSSSQTFSISSPLPPFPLLSLSTAPPPRPFLLLLLLLSAAAPSSESER